MKRTQVRQRETSPWLIRSWYYAAPLKTAVRYSRRCEPVRCGDLVIWHLKTFDAFAETEFNKNFSGCHHLTGLSISERIFIEIGTCAFTRMHRHYYVSNYKLHHRRSKFHSVLKTCLSTVAIIQLRLLTWRNVFDEQHIYSYSKVSGLKTWSVT